MPRGGPQPGSGRPKGKLNPATYEKLKVMAAVSQRIMAQADLLINAQLSLALGSVQVYRVDEKAGKTIHTLITDPEEITQVLDEAAGRDKCYTERGYYFVTEVPPDIRAIDSLFNRAFGKPKETIEVTDKTQEQIEKVALAFCDWLEDNPLATEEEKALFVKKFAQRGSIPVEALSAKITDIQTIQITTTQ